MKTVHSKHTLETLNLNARIKERWEKKVKKRNSEEGAARQLKREA